jgi:integrase
MVRIGPQHRLNPTFVRTCKKPGVYMDGGGLRFRVMPNGSRTWIMRITRELRDKASPCIGVARELGSRRNSPVHHAALPYAEVASFIRELRQRAGPLASRLAFEFLVLTATRSGEARGATWDEMDLSARLWTIPAHGMKARAEHIVPLSDRSVAIIKTARAAFPESDLCFPNAKGVRFSDMVFTKALRDMGLGERATAHGFRTSFKTWAAETEVRDEVSEAALAHTDPNRVRAAYRRTTFLDERRVVMQAWADVADGPFRLDIEARAGPRKEVPETLPEL